MRSSGWMRAVIAGLAGGVAWILGIQIFFGPAQILLTDPALQSAKMLAAFAPDASPPRALAAPGAIAAGILLIGILWARVYVWIAAGWPGSWWRRGLRFGVVGWVLMVPWFEFYLPWNVLLEPAPLVALELFCWALVLAGVALAIAGVENLMRPRSRPAEGS